MYNTFWYLFGTTGLAYFCHLLKTTVYIWLWKMSLFQQSFLWRGSDYCWVYLQQWHSNLILEKGAMAFEKTQETKTEIWVVQEGHKKLLLNPITILIWVNKFLPLYLSMQMFCGVNLKTELWPMKVFSVYFVTYIAMI